MLIFCTFSVSLPGVQLHPSKWAQMHFSGECATLTLTHLNKEDEGLYTMRVLTKSGYELHSAYVFVRGMRANKLVDSLFSMILSKVHKNAQVMVGLSDLKQYLSMGYCQSRTLKSYSHSTFTYL